MWLKVSHGPKVVPPLMGHAANGLEWAQCCSRGPVFSMRDITNAVEWVQCCSWDMLVAWLLSMVSSQTVTLAPLHRAVQHNQSFGEALGTNVCDDEPLPLGI
ncbi:hypothetical protein EI94DRAFT_1696122 [Lactarius quietus]|nr:hypothetical protein EI94DRAFT_1696122 [Lactarius quietus]